MAPRPAKEFRKCLVCPGATTAAHMGVDVCRACAIFYRRSAGKRTYICRTNSNACQEGPDGFHCRKCRFDHIERVLREAGVLKSDVAGCANDDQDPALPSCSGAPPSLPSASSCRPTMARMREAYKTMSEIRRISELNLRPDAPHPMEMRDFSKNLRPATVQSMNDGNRVFLSAALVFASTAFPDFATFTEAEQWYLVRNFFFRFQPFESTYRAHTIFPDHSDRSMGGYTTFLGAEHVDAFFGDCPNANVHGEQAARQSREICTTNFRQNRAAIARIEPRFDEFLAVAGIMFWTLGDQQATGRVVMASEAHRAAILQDLHVYYREELRVPNYAARLGELLTLVQLFEKTDDIKEFFEFLRLANVFSDDCLLYRMSKE